MSLARHDQVSIAIQCRIQRRFDFKAAVRLEMFVRSSVGTLLRNGLRQGQALSQRTNLSMARLAALMVTDLARVGIPDRDSLRDLYASSVAPTSIWSA